MIKKIVKFLFFMAMLATLVLPGIYIYNNPSMLATPTLSARGVANSVFPMLVTPTPMLATSTLTPKPSMLAQVQVFVLADTVHLRYEDGTASGIYLHRGDGIDVIWSIDNFGVITYPVNLAGLKIWRGCTSDNNNLGCEKK